VTISEGAIANILARAQAPLVTAAEPLAQAVRASPVVGSDETSARVGGKTPAFAGACLVAVGAAALTLIVAQQCRATWSRRGPANVPGASVTRRKLCHRGRLQRLRAGVQMAAAARHLHRPPPPRPQGQHPCVNTMPISNAGSTGCCAANPTSPHPAVRSRPCAATAMTCSASSPAATCPIPTMLASALCGHRLSSARSPDASARNGVPRFTPQPPRSSRPDVCMALPHSRPSATRWRESPS